MEKGLFRNKYVMIGLILYCLGNLIYLSQWVLQETGEVLIHTAESGSLEAEEGAVLNLVAGCWYLEILTGDYPVGLKRETEEMVYKLKKGMPYRLSTQDMIYLNRSKILVK